MESVVEMEDLDSASGKCNEKTINKTKRKPIPQRFEAAQDISEFNLNEVGQEKVKLSELIKTSQQLLGETANSVHKQLRKSKNIESLSVPLSKSELTKVKRASGYGKVCAELSKWQPIVQTYKAADQIIFPLSKPEIKQDSPNEEYDKAEAKLRFGEYMKHRAIVNYSQAKNKRQGKIKSKRYHRILKREKLKKIVKEFEDQGKTQAAAELLEKIRILERMTLKHKNTGKWAKIQKLRAMYNPEARMALKEDRLLGKELVQRTARVAQEEKQPEESRVRMVADDSSEDEEPQKPPPPRPSVSVSEKHIPADFQLGPEETVLQSVRPKTVIDVAQDDDESGEEGDDAVNMSEAFADADVIEEFKAEQEKAKDAARPKAVDNFLPGWGSWGGPGIKENQRKRKKFLQNPPESSAPKKAKVGNVIFSEEKNEKLEKLLVKQLPYVYTREQFESHICQPVSHTWNPMSSVRKLTAPKVRTRMGQIIRPLDMEDHGVEEKPQPRGAPREAEKRGKPTATAF